MKILSNKKYQEMINKQKKYEETLEDLTSEIQELKREKAEMLVDLCGYEDKIHNQKKQIEALKKNIREAYEVKVVEEKPKKATKKKVEEIDITMPSDKKQRVVKIEKEVVEPKKRGRKPNATK